MHLVVAESLSAFGELLAQHRTAQEDCGIRWRGQLACVSRTDKMSGTGTRGACFLERSAREQVG